MAAAKAVRVGAWGLATSGTTSLNRIWESEIIR